MTRKILSYLGISAMLTLLALNVSHALDGYGLMTCSLSKLVLAQSSSSSSGDGDTSGDTSGDISGDTSDESGSKEYKEEKKTDQNRVTKRCDGNVHKKTVEVGWKITCEGKGNVPCVERWTADTSKKPTVTEEECPEKSTDKDCSWQE